jgi:hypothetical protein
LRQSRNGWPAGAELAPEVVIDRPSHRRPGPRTAPRLWLSDCLATQWLPARPVQLSTASRDAWSSDAGSGGRPATLARSRQLCW